MEKGSPVRCTVVGDLPLVRTVGGHCEDLCSARLDLALRQQSRVFIYLFFGLGMEGAINHGFTVPGKKWPSIVSLLKGEPFRSGAVGVHRVNVKIAGSHGGEHNFLAIRRDGSFSIVGPVYCQPTRFGTVPLSAEDFIGGIDRPNIAPTSIWRWRTAVPRQMSRGVNEPLSVGEKISTGSPPFPCAQQFHVSPVDVHAEDLIAPIGGSGGLKNYFAGVKGKISFGVLTAKGELL